MLCQIAGLTVDLKAGGRTARQGAAYAAPAGAGAADFSVSCDPAKVLSYYPELGSLDEAEYFGTGIDFGWKLLDFGGLQFHASAVTLDGRAYLFSAPSGVGKSTHTERWVRLFGAEYLNDDKPALRRVDDVWRAYGTPWSGKYDLSRPASAPVGGIAFVCRGDQGEICPLTPTQALPMLLSQTLWTLGQTRMNRLLELVDHLLREVPMYRLQGRSNDDEARMAQAVMTCARR